MICLDSNAAIAAINQRVPEVRRRLEAVLAAGTAVGIPAIVLFELWYGIKKSDRQEESRENLARFLQLELEIWPFEPDDARRQATSAPCWSAPARPSAPTTS
jgi:tRNA(fMet)-specific endonuclease VapC